MDHAIVRRLEQPQRIQDLLGAPIQLRRNQVRRRSLENGRARSLGIDAMLVDAFAQVLDVLPARNDRRPNPAAQRHESNPRQLPRRPPEHRRNNSTASPPNASPSR